MTFVAMLGRAAIRQAAVCQGGCSVAVAQAAWQARSKVRCARWWSAAGQGGGRSWTERPDSTRNREPRPRGSSGDWQP